MPRTGYQDDLDDLRGDVLAMGQLVLGRLDDGLEALRTGDESLAREVAEGDATVNERYLELESRCIDLFALQQPVAGDLRFVAASFKILTDLERIADLAANLGRYALAGDESLVPEVSVGDIGTAARDLVARSLDAYADRDAAACRAIHEDDDTVDALCGRASEAVARDLVEREAATDAWELERLLDDVSQLLLTVRDLERVADHAVNIAARTLYMVESDPELIY
ncbi:phosphate signaling complex protein PhoU [Haloglomus salinum]|jgi:phosphate transport system protein|uniref:phosphate signaling complex protein PhoU n=1 Tax=Haloglomus salinum TaxID=2962673 RepID=UPI0020C99D4E|nr:phosphate signaling complex protein PhoU [Haloglomus salinum]